MPSSHTQDRTEPAENFVTTRWSVVQKAGGTGTASREALEKLCRGYWFPLYAYARRRGYSVEDAQDLTQGFFERLLEGNWVARADEAKGRFRTFLLTAMERFLANAYDRDQAQKRGGGCIILPVQLNDAETRYGVEPVDTRTPEQAFERVWAMTLLNEVVVKLEAEFRQQGQGELFARLKPCLVGDSAAQPYASMAAALHMEEGALRVAVHRLRQRYRELLRAEIADTLTSSIEVDAEMRYLFSILSG